MVFKCTDPKECKRKREKYEDLQEKFRPIGQEEMDSFIQDFNMGKNQVRFDRHFVKRSLERCISETDVSNVIQYGWVIERNKSQKSTSIVILGYVGSNYRPLHVVVDIVSDNLWIVVTAYDPQSHSWKWNENFDSRVCFCNPEETE